MGIVDELGSGVTLLKKGDRVVMPFNVADGGSRPIRDRFRRGAYGFNRSVPEL